MEGLAVGRIVHYVSPVTGMCQGAIVAHVGEDLGDGVVNLGVFDRSGASLGRMGVCFDISKASGTWHWPEKV